MNEKRTTPAPAGLSLGDIYHVLFRHKWKILAVWAAGLSAAAVLWVAWPVPYQSEAELFVKYVENARTPNPVENGANIRTPELGGMSIINSEMQILASFDLAQRVAETVGPEKILAKTGGGTNVLKAAGVIRMGLKTEVSQNSSVIRVTFHHPDRDVVQPVLKELIDGYQKMHGEVHQGLGILDDSLRKSKDELTSDLKSTEKQLQDAFMRAGIKSVDDMKNYSAVLFRVREGLAETELELAEHQAALDSMSKFMPTNTPLVSIESSNPPPDKVDQYKRICSLLDGHYQTERTYLLQGFKPDSKFVAQVREQIEMNEGLKKKMEDEFPQLVKAAPAKAEVVEPQPVVSKIAVFAEQAKIASLIMKSNALNQQLTNVLQRMTLAENEETNIRDLQNKRDQQAKNLAEISTSVDRFRYDEMLSAGRNFNISPIQQPLPPGQDNASVVKIVRLLLMGAFAGGIALAFLLELYLDRSFKRPIEIEAKLSVPLFLSIPQTNLNGKHSRLAGLMQNTRLLPWNSHEGKNGTPEPASVETPTHLPLQAVQRLNPFFEALRDRLIMFFEMKNMTHKPKLVAVTSCGRGAGVTTVASGLAASLSETGEGNVLLVDMNIEGGAAHYFHRGQLECGLDDALELEKRDSAMVQNNLYVVSEFGNDKLPRILHKRFSSLMPKLKASDYDYIIFDMPPVNQISPTSRVARFMDMVMLVVESEKTERDAVRRASDILAETKTNVSVVLNKTRTYIPKRLQPEN